ncbi:MAG: DUF4843 domain-containing protein [Dysgonomonas sp.]|nr:DUF4843 domain-containing protein [Dysgonomonas sp.]
MKIYKYILPILLCAGIVVSCEHDKLDTYKEKDNIYFNYAEASMYGHLADSVNIRLGYDFVPKDDSTVYIKVKVMGNTVNYDRTVNIKLVTGASTAKIGEDIELMHGTIPADSIRGFVGVKIKNTSKLSTNTLLAELELVANDDFDTNYRQCGIKDLNDKGWNKATFYRVFFDAKNEMPNLWADKISNFTNIFGEFSRVKLQFICKTVGVDISYFEYDPETENVNTVYNERFSVVGNSWVRRCYVALEEYKKVHGALLDENKNEVVFKKGY